MGSMFITDLDGTLANAKHQISIESVEAFHQLGRAGVTRVIATGRNFYSARKVLAATLPFDYLILSGGVGVAEWPGQDLLHTADSLAPSEVLPIAAWLRARQKSFMVQRELPDNHYFQFFRSGLENSDFDRRCEIYAGFCSPWVEAEMLAASQIIVVEHHIAGVATMVELQAQFPQLSVVRATSPLDHQSAWIEISSSGVSKAAAAAWLCQRLSIDRDTTVALGNDFNDLSLLDWAGSAYIVANAPEALKSLRYQMVASNDDNGFAMAVERCLGLSK